jgi:hypothetical protein
MRLTSFEEKMQPKISDRKCTNDGRETSHDVIEVKIWEIVASNIYGSW